MKTIIFNGKEFARKKELQLKKEVNKLKKQGITPKLVSVLVGDNPASTMYVSLKKKAAERIGDILDVRNWKQDAGYGNLIEEIKKLNKDKSIHGIMVQLPLPADLKVHTKEVVEAIDPKKDVDGLRDDSPFLHATAKAIVQIIKVANADVSKKVCVIGAHGMVGRPLVKELKREGYEVSECHSTTKDLKDRTLAADILVSATGQNNLIKVDMVKDGAIVIDVGSPKGDIDFESVSKRAAFITPVPGGVGPVTIVSLLDNLLIAAKNLVK